MKKVLLAVLLFLALPSLVGAQIVHPSRRLVSELPSAATNQARVYGVTDGLTEYDCTQGGGSHAHDCVSDGTVWLSVFSGCHLASANPTTGDDSGDGYVVGARWCNTTTDEEFVALDISVGAAVWKSTTSPGADRLPVNQATHGFSPNQWVTHDDATNSWVLLDTDTLTEDHNGVGFVASVQDANNFTVSVGGLESWSAHGLDLGPFYASSTAGVVTTTTPALGTKRWLLGIAADTSTIVIYQLEWSQQ